MVVPNAQGQDLGSMPQSPMFGDEATPQDNGAEPPMEPSMGGDPTMGDMDAMDNSSDIPNEFDHNFDAGVEANEDEDPKRYIQQLTGKLSQSLNDYNTDNGNPDAGLCKYVGKMILKQAAKGLDDKAKKELIHTLNSEDVDSDDVDFSQDEMEQDSEMPSDEMENIQETCVFTKKEFQKIFENLGTTCTISNDDRTDTTTLRDKKNKKNPFCGR